LAVDPHPAGTEVHLDALHRLVEGVARHGRVALVDHDIPAGLDHDRAVGDGDGLLDALVVVEEVPHVAKHGRWWPICQATRRTPFVLSSHRSPGRFTWAVIVFS